MRRITESDAVKLKIITTDNWVLLLLSENIINVSEWRVK